MKKLSLLLLVLLAGGVCFAQQLPINCATNTPCTQNGPINTKTGDPLWQVGYKLNFNFNQIFGAFGATGLLRGNGPLPNPLTPATYADVAALFTGCSSATPALGYQGTCVSGGGSGGMVYPGAGIPDSTGTAWGTSYATTGSGDVVLSTSPTLVTPALGTPSAIVLTNGTGLPIAGLTGLGTGVGTALGVNTGSAGSFVVNGGALGTPSSGVGTNITGVDAASVGGYTLPCTVPTMVSGDYLTNNGTACSWGAVSSAFSALTSGTNTAAAMLVGTGATLGPTGTGTVSANEINGVIQGVTTATAGNTLTPDCAYSMDKVTATTYLIPAPTQSAPSTASTGGSLAGNTYYYVVTAETSVGQTTVSVQQAINSDADVPPTNGTLTATSGGTLAATTYYVESTWVTASGQTTGATETSLAVAADNVLNVAAPASPPSNATGWNVYVSTGSGNEELQNSSPLGTTTAWVEPTTGLVTGAIVPTLNTAYLTNTNENIINWTAVTGATGYIVYRSTTANDFTNATSYTTSGGGGSALTFTDTGASGTTATPPTSNTTGQFTINAPASCTPTDGQKLEVKIISPAGGLITYAWPSTIIGSTQLALPLTSAGAGLEDYFQLQYDADLTDWVMLSYNQGF